MAICLPFIVAGIITVWCSEVIHFWIVDMCIANLAMKLGFILDYIYQNLILVKIDCMH